MSIRSLTRIVPLVVLTLLLITPKIYAQRGKLFADNERTDFQLRDAAIRDSLVAISTGKLPPSDDKLVELITQNVKEAALRATEPSAGIEAAARQAQESVSEVTAAYTAVIFQSSSVKEAERLFARFQDTVEKIVDFARSGNFVVRYQPKGKESISNE